MRRLPSPEALVASIDYSQDALTRIRRHSADLLRRRQHDAGGDGYPKASMGGGGATGGLPSSTTEVAALAKPELDPIARYIDTVLEIVAECDKRLQQANSCLANVLQVEAERRGRVASVLECECCEAPITGIGDDRRRAGLCPACYAALKRWRPTAEDPTARSVFITWRRHKLAS